MARNALVAPAVLAAFLLTGCSTLGPRQADGVAALNHGVAATRAQGDILFVTENALTRRQAIERRIRIASPNLTEADFPVAVTPGAVARWHEVFDILDAYTAALRDLAGDTRAKATGDAITSIGERLNAPNIDAKVPDGVSAGLATFGQALVKMRSEHEAVRIMRATDAGFSETTNLMAMAVGAPQEPGSLANSVYSHWTNGVLPAIERDFNAAKRGDLDRRRRVSEAYVTAMDARDRQLAEVATFHQSILALGEAHRAAAFGKPGDALDGIERLDGWVDDMKTRLARAEETTKP